jgi:alkylation response protein AidB-like acyl-CoA dehydrogenase
MLTPMRRSTDTGFSREELARARYDDGGVFIAGRKAELDALRLMGARDASLGRLYEGHFNGVLLTSLYGNRMQRMRAWEDASDGHLFGVWNTQDADGLEIAADAAGHVLRGSKTWASGADSVTRALVTARRNDGAIQMCLVRVDEVDVTVDDSAWRPHGMEASNSFRISFDGVRLREEDLIGNPGNYERSPWFFGGALRFVAVHVGIVERLCAEVFAYLAVRGRERDPLQQARVGEMRIALQSARNWLTCGLDAWRAFDEKPSPATAAGVVDIVDMARLGVERSALDIVERAVRGVGAHGLLAPLPFGRLVRDLEMYLRQPAPDATLLRVGTRGMASDSAARSERIAD